jgi:UPF0755 protein
MKRFFLFLILIFSLFGCFYIYQGIYSAKSPGSSLVAIFLVKKGEGAKKISINLKNQSLIKSALLFQGYIFARGESGRLKAGKYELSPAMNIPQIAAKLVSGEAIKQKITIIEGWNLKDIGNYLEKKGIAAASDFIKYGEEKKLEGYLFPDTYEISSEDGVKEIAGKMRANFNKKLTPALRKKIADENKTIFEITTMASLIEKEVRTAEDKKIVSGILWKRLKFGVPLQVDATISYLTGKKNTRISKEDLKINSLYNTYKYAGLPLGPICNPGIESIIAAVYPKNSGYWYYLSSPDGATHFSKTLKEHNIKKAKYLR